MSDIAAATPDAEVPSFDSARHFWARFYDWITKRKGDPLTEDDLKAGVQFARSSAGGAALSHKRTRIMQAADALALCDMGMSLTPKLAKAEADYREGEGERVCGHCRFFQMGTCSLVEGSIEATDTCDLWHARVRSWLPSEPVATYREVIVAEGDEGPRLFADVSLADVPDVIPILPARGTYTHPVYGAFDVTPRLIDEVIANFTSRARPQDVLLDLEHFDVQAGVPGRITKLIKREDGGLDGIPEFTDLGKKLIKRDRFKYCSADLRTYTNPLTGEKTPNVLVRVALTNSPFFKEDHMPRMAASEGAVDDLSPFSFAESDLPDSCFAHVPDDAKGVDGAKSKRKLRLCNMSGDLDAGIIGAAAAALGPGFRGQKVSLPADAIAGAKAKVRAAWKKIHPEMDMDQMPEGVRATEGTMSDNTPVAMTEEQRKAFREELMTEARREFAEQLATEAAARKLAEDRVATLEADKQTKQFTDEVMGRSSANDGGSYVFAGDAVTDYVAILRALPATEREAFQKLNRRIAQSYNELAAHAGREIGSDAPGETSGGAWGKIAAKAKLVAEANKVTFAEAVDAVAQAEPALYEAYVAEQRRK